jgi:hypothetical protein
MKSKRPKRDPIAAYQREQTASRSVGGDRKCSCGEARPVALCRRTDPMICYECKKKARGVNTAEDHHVGGKVNHPATLPMPANDHAFLSELQRDWPRETLENVTKSPLLAAAGCLRGFVDYLFYLVETFLIWIASLLEELDTFLSTTLGQMWWKGTEIQKFEAK